MIRIHSSFHKCLTMYYMKVMDRLYNSTISKKPAYQHFESIEGVFYNRLTKYQVISCNGFAVNLNYIPEDFRISRFIRDPRDLIVSGYFYHKRGAEPWFRFPEVTEKYWSPINGSIPSGMNFGQSYAEYLQGISLEKGLIAEIEFRKKHLESLRQWKEDPRIRLFRYEDIINNEASCFRELLKFYELSPTRIEIGTFLAKKYSYANMRKKNKHIRNPTPGQWKSIFTPEVTDYFNYHYSDILERYEYD